MATTQGKVSVPQLPEAINIAGGIKGFILWIGASLGGITALLYASGYLVTRAHLHMLGLYGFVEFDSDHFLQEGAKFFLAVAYDLAVWAGLVFTAIGMVLVPAVVASLIGKRRVLPLLERFSAWRELRRSTQAPRIARGLFYGVLFATLIQLTGNDLNPFYAPLCISDLLYSQVGNNECSSNPNQELYQLSSPLNAALLSGNSAPLETFFAERLNHVYYFILLAAVAWTTVAPWRRRGWLILPFLVSMGLFLMLMTMDYGVLKRPTVYPLLRLTADKDADAWNGDTLYLLNKTDSEFVAWNASAHKVIWVPAGSQARAEIVRMHDLFGAPATTAPAVGERK